MKGVLEQLNTSPGGMPKLPVLMAWVSIDGVGDDRHKNLKYHGGHDRAVCLYSVELYDELRRDGVDLQLGSVGENFSTRDIDLQALKPGDQLKVGAECVIEIVEIREPCKSLKQWHPDLIKIIYGRSGWMAKVITEANVKPGDAIELIGTDRNEVVK